MADVAHTPSLEDLVSRHGLKAQDLELACPLHVRNMVAVKLVDWMMVGHLFNISKEKLAAIDHDNATEDQRKVALLDTWSEKEGNSASYLKLADVLHQRGRNDLVEFLCDKIKGSVKQVDIVSQAPAHHRDYAVIKAAFSKIKGDFSRLVIKVKAALEAQHVDGKEVRDFLLTYFEGECDIPDVSDLREIFNSVTTAKLWHYDHYEALEQVAESFLPDNDEARRHITEYINQRSAFFATTRIVDFVKLTTLEDPEEDDEIFSPKKYNRHYRKLELTLGFDMSAEVTLEYIDKLWRILKKKFMLPSLTTVIDKIVEGCLKVTWLVLPHAIEKIMSMSSEAFSFFQQHGITRIVLYDRLILYDEGLMQTREKSAISIAETTTLVQKLETTETKLTSQEDVANVEVQKEDLENQTLKETLMDMENIYIPTIQVIQVYASDLHAKISDLVTFAQDNIPPTSEDAGRRIITMKTELNDLVSKLDTRTEELKEKFEMDGENIRTELCMQEQVGKKIHLAKWLEGVKAVPPSDSGFSTKADDPDDISELEVEEPIRRNVWNIDDQSK